MGRQPPRSTRTDTLFPSPTLVRSGERIKLRFQRTELPACFVAQRLETVTSLHNFPVLFEPRACPSPSVALKRFCAVVQVSHNLLDFIRALTIVRSEEQPSELQSLMRISYAVFCLKNKTTHIS